MPRRAAGSVGREEMTLTTLTTRDVPIQVIVAAFDSRRGARFALERLKEMAEGRLVIGVCHAAVLRRGEDDRLRITQTSDLRTGKSGAIGAFVGGVAGLLAGPIGWAALGGAWIGAMAYRLRDAGFPAERLRQIGGSLTPGTSALIVEVERTWVGRVERLLAEVGGDVTYRGAADRRASVAVGVSGGSHSETAVR